MLVVEDNFSAILNIYAGNQIDAGRFSAAVGANQRQNFALIYVKAQVINCVNSRKRLVQALNLQQFVHDLNSFYSPGSLPLGQLLTNHIRQRDQSGGTQQHNQHDQQAIEGVSCAAAGEVLQIIIA